MQKTNLKPAIVPTVYSARTALGTVALVALFGAFLWLYSAYGSLQRARARMDESTVTRVDMPLYTVTLPPGWAEYAVNGNSLTVLRTSGCSMPVIHIDVRQDRSFLYHALDENPAVMLKALDEDISKENLDGMAKETVLENTGTELFTVKPGVSAVRILFDAGAYNGEGVMFYIGDVRYLVWAVQDDLDLAATAETGDFFRRLFENLDLPEMREQIDRPVVHSGRLTAEMNAETQLKVGREMALWRLFESRVDTEPDVALLPALTHYREALTLLSSIRQERVAIGSEAFERYQDLLEKRRRDVAEWFVVLDKAVAMQDWPRARRQAEWIVRHATLTGERMDARRASDILATKIPPEE